MDENTAQELISGLDKLIKTIENNTEEIAKVNEKLDDIINDLGSINNSIMMINYDP